MKLIMTWLSVCLICVGLGYAGKLLIDKEYDSPSRTTVTFTEDEAEHKLTAKYPISQSGIIREKLESWIGRAVSQTGSLGDELHLKFPDGGSCRVHAKGRDLEIVAAKNENTYLQLERLKSDYKIIHDFIVLQARENKKK